MSPNNGRRFLLLLFGLLVIVCFPATSSHHDGDYLAIGNDFRITRIIVTGSRMKVESLEFNGGEMTTLRPPRVSSSEGYNFFVSNFTQTNAVIPDLHALHILTSEGVQERVSLDSCDPLMLTTSQHDNSILLVLCSPEVTKVRVYRVSMVDWTVVSSLVFTSDAHFLPNIGILSELEGDLYVILGTEDGLVYASKDRPQVMSFELQTTCSSVIALTLFPPKSATGGFLKECGNRTERTVESTFLCELSNLSCSSVHTSPGQKLGKLVVSSDGSILVNIAANQISIQNMDSGVILDPIQAGTGTFHDGFVETVKESHTLIYSEKGGKVRLFDITLALKGVDVPSKTFEGDYATCRDCSGLLQLKEGFFVTATAQGVAWFSIKPPNFLRERRGFDATRLIYFPSSRTGPHNTTPNPTQQSNASTSVGGVIGGVFGGVFGILVVIVIVGVVVLAIRRREQLMRCVGRSPQVVTPRQPMDQRTGNMVVNEHEQDEHGRRRVEGE